MLSSLEIFSGKATNTVCNAYIIRRIFYFIADGILNEIMRQLLLSILLLFAGLAHAQKPGYQEKLYYTCKIWGFVKYYHSEVSVCKVNWDSVLVSRFPAIKAAVGITAFNNELDTLLKAAGPMALAATPAPLRTPGLKHNLDLAWIHDPLLRSDVQSALDMIKHNFRPHAGCWVQYNDYTTGSRSYLLFPHDSMTDVPGAGRVLPPEPVRALLLFKYWNILRYFNPYNDVLDQPWDSTLYREVLPVVTAADPKVFYLSFRKVVAGLDDAHAEGFTYNSYVDTPLNYYAPRLALRYVAGQYMVVRSGINGIGIGDVIDSVAGISIPDKEKNMRPYLSAGNEAVLHRTISKYLLNGSKDSPLSLVVSDRSGMRHTVNTIRAAYIYDKWFLDDYYPVDSSAAVHWKILNGNTGYVHMGNLAKTEVEAMYHELRDLPAIIFDIRNYPQGTLWQLAPLMFPGERTIAAFSTPDINYPGAYTWEPVTMGVNGNLNAYKGKVIILVNELTQSQAEYTCMGLKAMNDVTVVGSQTAGTDGNITYFKLTADLQTGFTTLGTYYADGGKTQRIGIIPDVPVAPTRPGIIAGRDEVLENALEIAAAAIKANGSAPLVPPATIPAPKTATD